MHGSSGFMVTSFPGSCAGEEEREPGTHCSRMRQVPLVTCILLRYTKITVNFCLLLKATLHSYTACGTHTSDFEVKNNIALMVTICIASFEVIGELQREKLRQSRAKALSWNGRMRGQFPQAKRRIPSSLPRHRPHTVQSVAGSFYTREVGVLAEVSVKEQVLREISKYPEILGKLRMRKQCVPGSFLPAHAREPGNEVRFMVNKYPILRAGPENMGSSVNHKYQTNKGIAYRKIVLQLPMVFMKQLPNTNRPFSIETRVNKRI